jgi:hypothetical protein
MADRRASTFTSGFANAFKTPVIVFAQITTAADES